MFALRQRILGPASSAAKRSFGSNLVQPHSSCLSLATEKLAPSLFVEQRNNTAEAATRRSLSTTTIDPNFYHSLAVEESSFVVPASKYADGRLASTACLPSLTVARMIASVASNWFVSAWTNHNWNDDGFFLISTLKRRRKMMNKHKLRKRRKKNRMKNKK